MDNINETVVNSAAQDVQAPADVKDLREGMTVMATIKKVVNFGAFADIGVGMDGLIHISKMSDKYVSDPNDIVAVGDKVKVKVLSVDLAAKKISLSMREDEGKPRAGGNGPRRDNGGRRDGGFGGGDRRPGGNNRYSR